MFCNFEERWTTGKLASKSEWCGSIERRYDADNGFRKDLSKERQ